ncbi:MAG: UPF0182 family protein [Chloroflexota bacterium]|nr:UPF0182 family protein [Chloroflexota bacterium]
MEQKSRYTTIGCATVVGALVALFFVFASAISIYTDWLWFDSLGQLSTYQTRLWTRVELWLAGALLVIAVLVINWLVIPRRLLGPLQLRLRGLEGLRFTLGSRWFTFIAGSVIAIIALTMASETGSQWMTFLSFGRAAPFGLSDPLFGLDASFYVFKLPFYHFILDWLLGMIVTTLIGSVLVYLIAQRIQDKAATMHLSVLGVLFLVGKAVDYQLQRFALLGSSQGLVFGAGYTDVHARLPLLNLLTGIILLGVVLLLVNIFARRWKWLLITGVAWLTLSVLGPLYPAFVQRFTVHPNELALEWPYIEHNIHFTRYAYGLKDVQESDYRIEGVLDATRLAANADTLANVRLWDWRPLRTTYEQLQEIRTYYTFADVDVDRYMLDGRLHEVTLAARELDVEQLREDARTWINQHLIYTHGYGLCLSTVAEVSEEGLPHLLVRNIPPQSTDPALAITRPGIYFGEKSANYAIVNTTEDEFDYPSGDENVYARYQGPDGVQLGGFLRRVAFALHFDSLPILLSEAIRPDSRILFHRALSDRVETLAPMLWFDADPYPVIIDGKIIWLYDAYTWSARFPYSNPTQGLNYIRNSVKITVDAYTGETTFYVVDPSDPLIQTYQAVFPDLFTPVEEMDASLREHWRYPEQLFRIQADVYAAYHMQDPRVFYNQEDLWQTPMEMRDTGETLMSPYYVIMRLPDAEETEFIMIRPYVPAGKQNMIAWLYADSDGPDYGQLGVFKFSKEALVYGPMQVEARIDQDPYISQQLTLWNQRGSSVIRGNLMVIPIDGTLLYIEPLYLQAESSQLPELKRVLVAHGNRVAMANDLETGLTQVLDATSETAIVEPSSSDVGELARSAQAHYEAAQECLRREDWACYGAELEALASNLEALVAATEPQ